jgi:hypothetical protein
MEVVVDVEDVIVRGRSKNSRKDSSYVHDTGLLLRGASAYE